MTLCAYCGAALDSEGQKVGRPQKYCGTSCRQAAHRSRKKGRDAACRNAGTTGPRAEAPGKKPQPAVAPSEDVIIEIIRDLHEETRQLLRSVESGFPSDPLRRTLKLRNHLDNLTAGLVGRARHHRITWSRIGALLSIREDTARHRFTDAHIQRRLRHLSGARTVPPSLGALYAGAPPPAKSSTAGPNEEGPPLPRTPASAAYNRLAPVLSMLARASQLPLQELGDRCGCSPSYMSRILNGERVPSWPITERFAVVCGADTAVLRDVWESEQLRDRTPRDQPAQPCGEPVLTKDTSGQSIARLMSALRTLHIRAGRPTAAAVAASAYWYFTPDDVTRMLGGRLAEWRSLERLVHALGGNPDYFLPLWRAVEARLPAAPNPADSRGGEDAAPEQKRAGSSTDDVTEEDQRRAGRPQTDRTRALPDDTGDTS
ncbi:XRE family transcriptional regulator [Streptomyces armeniacus]|uniref:XRE family transcriptional regulator n=1 Tax=Streptomyces armeniacus TaxID=83291 RepID=A0A345XXY7_9ACTN|nr:helix-turn-helix transcriptional regulator [Streptomyces armeniacus]AXK36503.1 XRE family transcriptional regulator [Streptomyces armeniacus]